MEQWTDKQNSMVTGTKALPGSTTLVWGPQQFIQANAATRCSAFKQQRLKLSSANGNVF